MRGIGSTSILVVITLILAACSGSNNRPSPVNGNGDPIIGTDFQNNNMSFPGGVPMFLSIIELDGPALLEEKEITEEARQRILAEQADMERKLKAISNDINVIYRYRLVLNALAIEAPQEVAEQINELENVSFIEADERFSRPKVFVSEEKNLSTPDLSRKNSMTFIGVDKVQSGLSVSDASGVSHSVQGQGVRVGIIDTGIDYTHEMLGGAGNVELYESMDSTVNPESFPNKKVIGGFDFAGSRYNPGSHLYASRIPKPDENPIDRGGHGTHVAGTVAGIGDGVNTYDGAAPKADLYALKVFGDGGGGTSDTIVIAALEYSADPNGDLSTGDRLDVVNLSLGGAYGKPHNLYRRAVKNLTEAGTLTVAAAGNSGPESNIVGAPSTADEALSVAASIDDMDHNIKFEAIRFESENDPSLLAEVIEGPITTPVSEIGDVGGKLVPIGIAAEDLPAELQEQLKGHIALIDRGQVSFVDKIQRAVDAGALGVIMVNNQDGPPIAMGGEGDFKVPGVMITKALGEAIKRDINEGVSVSVAFKTDELIEKPELVDTLTGFSSQGPRDFDSLIKPEITAPGLAIISAEAGGGNKGLKLGGTSMASPHVAGVAALLRQYKKELGPKEAKSLLMTSGILISDDNDSIYPVSRQGAGRIDAYKALTGVVTFSDSGVSLGRVSVEAPTQITRTVTLKSIANHSVTYSVEVSSSEFLKVETANKITLPSGAERELDLKFTLLPTEEAVAEINAHIFLKQDNEISAVLPALAMVSKTTQLKLDSLLSQGRGEAKVIVSNEGSHAGSALLFNLLGTDPRKEQPSSSYVSSACDLQSAGYRVVQRGEQRFLQVASKLFNPVSGWEACDVHVEFDLDNDNESDVEIYGSSAKTFPGFGSNPQLRDVGLSTLVFDSAKLRELEVEYEKEVAKQEDTELELSYVPALINLYDMKAFQHSTLGVTEIDMGIFGTAKSIQMKLAVTYNGGYVVEGRDELDEGAWRFVSLESSGMGFSGMSEEVVLEPGASQEITLQRGLSDKLLVAYFPRNRFVQDLVKSDSQSQIIFPDQDLSPVTLP